MNRTVIGFLEERRAVKAFVERPTLTQAVRVDLDGVDGRDSRARGEALLAILRKREEFKACLDAALALPVGSGPAPLYFSVGAPAADAVAWEALYSPNLKAFCALDARWPIGRIARTRATVAPLDYEPPVRVVAVLGAAGRDGRTQLRGLVDAVRKSPVPATLHVISGDGDVLAELKKLNKKHRTDYTSELIAGTAPDLVGQLAAARPTVLHLLCHGGSVLGAQVLSFAKVSDVDAGETTGSLTVYASSLSAGLLGAVWLVVLAACESGAAAAPADGGAPGDLEGMAIAHQLVNDGLPAAIGMRRVVDLHDVDVFTTSLYPEVLATIGAAVGTANRRSAPIDWAGVLTNPRNVLSDGHPLTTETWLDPVLYAQFSDLFVTLPAAGAAPAAPDGGDGPAGPAPGANEIQSLRATLDVFVGYLNTVDPLTADPDVIRNVTRRVAELKKRLKELGA